MPDSIPDTSDDHSSDPSDLNVDDMINRISEDIERIDLFDGVEPTVLYIPIPPEYRTGSRNAENLNFRYEDFEHTRPTIYEEGSVCTIAIFLQINLIPGELWPMAPELRNLPFISQWTSNQFSFGACEKINENGRTFGTIGVISSNTENSRMIALVGHQRFEVLEVLRQGFETCIEARVKIMKDVTLYYPMTEPSSNPRTPNLGHRRTCSKRDTLRIQWPPWVYKQFDVHELASNISKKVKMLCKDIQTSDNPIFLSFQVTKIGIFTEAQVIELLGLELTNLRLQRELHYINNLNVIEEYVCAGSDCGAQITKFETIFSTSTPTHKSSCEYWNTSRNMITLTHLDGYLNKIKFLNKSTECSCFPGYNSTSIICRTCNNHLGWIFVVDRKKSVTPGSFYGLSINALIKTVKLLPLNM